jgi:hypothetical protein
MTKSIQPVSNERADGKSISIHHDPGIKMDPKSCGRTGGSRSRLTPITADADHG